MAPKKGGLGRGFDALFSENSMEETSAAPVKLSINDIEPNRNQPRRVFDDSALSELASSIAAHGVLQPLLVRPMPDGSYQLVAGERRWRASRIAGLTEVPVVIKSMTDEEAAVFALIENLQREDLNPVEEASGIQRLMDDFGFTQEQAGERLGKSRPAVANALRLLKLPAKILDSITAGDISAGHGRALLALEDEKKIIEAEKIIIAKKLSVRETEKLVKAMLKEKKPAQVSKSTRDSFFDEVELSIAGTLGRKAKVMTKPGKESGTIEIDFYDKDDLKRLAAALSSLED